MTTTFSLRAIPNSAAEPTNCRREIQAIPPFSQTLTAWQDRHTQTLLLLAAVCTLLFYLYSALEMAFGSRTIAKLEDIPPLTSSDQPKVSVVIAACNEERGIEQALTSVLHQDYRDYEVIVVNGRSTDRTGEILHRMSQANPRLQLITIHQLPPAWLGKNHALHQGAARASGSCLVFTDADVVMHPSVLSRAVMGLGGAGGSS